MTFHLPHHHNKAVVIFNKEITLNIFLAPFSTQLYKLLKQHIAVIIINIKIKTLSERKTLEGIIICIKLSTITSSIKLVEFFARLFSAENCWYVFLLFLFMCFTWWFLWWDSLSDWWWLPLRSWCWSPARPTTEAAQVALKNTWLRNPGIYFSS